jgi:glycerol-3-phosphate dehydrogenase
MRSVALSPQARESALEQMASHELDVLVIGGGVVGSGCALDAATRGLRVGLVEARDLASGTSSRSSKLVHGGLRYLEMLDFRLVAEALRERDLLLHRLAPTHLVRPIPFPVPVAASRLGAGCTRAPAWRCTTRLSRLSGHAGVPLHRHLTRRGARRIAPSPAQGRPGRGIASTTTPGRRCPAHDVRGPHSCRLRGARRHNGRGSSTSSGRASGVTGALGPRP